MHISEGVLNPQVLITGSALAVIGTAIGLKKLDYDRVPQVAILSATFFVASLIHIPLGPGSVHLVLNGLMGLFLGWVAFPVILVGLTLQAILFQFGGLTTLGINTLNMALPAIICYYIFEKSAKNNNFNLSVFTSFLAGAGAVFMSSLAVALSLIFTEESFWPMAKLIVLMHFPVMIIEGLIVAVCVQFLKKVRPEMLDAAYVK
ncbi:MAG: cobalt transporter CbiM [Deltaproteobacteria bacterium]|nr:cobalt transporter CbiM [Deltaproteobacteria bacterium]MBW2051445.1 cobalt transporter CbiM [Deltaproteobacteria bacterium]MBW2140673.1 cobalt transporter CbiM [Deltaproteobacteria bacterium]MBW2322634.1 cobalt transporter CbiM [Deltaproteobacteria bacterium]